MQVVVTKTAQTCSVKIHVIIHVMCQSQKYLGLIQISQQLLRHGTTQNAYSHKMQVWDVLTFEAQSCLYSLSSCDQSWMDGWMGFEKNYKLRFSVMQSLIIKCISWYKIAILASDSNLQFFVRQQTSGLLQPNRHEASWAFCTAVSCVLLLLAAVMSTGINIHS